MNFQIKAVLDEITVNDIDEQYSEVIRVIGLNNFFRLCEYVGGSGIYIPTLDSITMPYRKNKVVDDYNGYNKKQLSKKYGLSERTIYRLLS